MGLHFGYKELATARWESRLADSGITHPAPGFRVVP
jgi:hypothetical protein